MCVLKSLCVQMQPHVAGAVGLLDRDRQQPKRAVAGSLTPGQAKVAAEPVEGGKAPPINALGPAKKKAKAAPEPMRTKVLPVAAAAAQELDEKVADPVTVPLPDNSETASCTNQITRQRHPSVTPAPFPKLEQSVRDRDRGYREVAADRGGIRHITGSRAQFPAEENMLYMHFVWRWQIEGFKTSSVWFRLKMADLLAASQPVGWTRFSCSDGWLRRFMVRFRISSQCTTNEEMVSVCEMPERGGSC
jgi:hypothetical protein